MNKLLIVLLPLAALVIFASVIVFNDAPKDNQAEETSSPNLTLNDQQPVAGDSYLPQGPSDLASQWQWVNKTEDDKSVLQTTVPLFTEQSVYNALQAVKVDENGDVILDHDALISLDEALERIYNRLDGASLLELQNLIENALPSKVGKQVAGLVGDYHNFLQAQDSFNQMNQGVPGQYDEPTVTSIEADKVLYSELQALRKLHLGNETAENLFKVSDANALYMFNSMQLSVDSSLSGEEKAKLQQENESKLAEALGQSNANGE